MTTLTTLQTARQDIQWSRSIGQTITCNGCPKMAEPIKMPWLWTWVGQRKHVLNGAHWRHLANTTEPSLCVSDAALCWIIL